MKIFISYRHTDKPELVELFSRELNNREEVSKVFQDIFSIPPGIEFDKYIRYQIEQMDVVLVIIGTEWIDEFKRRENTNDFVLIEVETALTSGKLTIPILIDGTTMPKEEELPQSIKSFARRNSIVLRPGKDLDHDITDLLSHLKTSLNLHENIMSEKPGQRIIALQSEDLTEIWSEVQAHIYNQVYKDTETKLFDVPRLMNQAELRPLEFHTIVYAVDELENCKYLNTPQVKQLIENALSEVIGVTVFTKCLLSKSYYNYEYENFYHEYVTLAVAIKEEQQNDESMSNVPQDLDDIPF